LLLILILIRAPDGTASHAAGHARALVSRILSLVRGAPRLGSGAPAPALPARLDLDHVEHAECYRATPKHLSLSGVTVAYEAFRALDDVTLEVLPGQVVGLIGPNGAGKTTLIDAVTGYTGVREGDITLDGRSVVGRSPRSLALLGIGRSFQSLELFDDMTVLENLLVAT